MASLHMQNSDDYRGGKFTTLASIKEWTIFLGGEGEGEGEGLLLPQSETDLEGEVKKYCRHPVGSVTQLQRLFKALCECCSNCIQRFFFTSF